MGVDVITLIIGVAGAIGAYFGGKQQGKSTAVGVAVDVVELLQVQVQALTEDNKKKDALIADLRGRVELLEGLVTQRAEVEAVHVEVRGVRTIVDRIAEAVGVDDDA